MDFGLWFEPEMVNPDSELLRTHPDWILAAGAFRSPREQRQQQVLDLTRPEVFAFLFERVSSILAAHPIDYVKWDHNRDLLEAGTGRADGVPAVHEQTLAFYRLLDQLRTTFPDVAWESCASGGGRIDLSVLERVERVWTSDMTDAVARQQIQRWTTQLVAPEYLGAHVSSPTSHTTGRTIDLDFRCATALFGAFGIEWDLTEASDEDLDRVATWVARHKTLAPAAARGAGRTTGVVGPDRAAARRRRSRPLGGAAGARGDRRERPQPRGRGAGARTRPGGVVPAELGGPGLAHRSEHVRAPPGRRSDRTAWR